MRIVGLTEQAHAKIDEHEMFPVPIAPDRTGADELIPLNKYVWIRDSAREQLEWLDHMIADFQRRKVQIMNDPNDTGEYFREYVQDTDLDADGAVVYLSLQHAPTEDGEFPHLLRIKEYDWTDQQILEHSNER